MENLFVESEVIVYRRQDRETESRQSTYRRKHLCIHFNLIKEEMSVRSMEIVEVLSPYHKEHIKTKFQPRKKKNMSVMDIVLELKIMVKIRGRIFSNLEKMM
ncbi:hypothetical protein YC2023_060011 [Brassica napus]